MEVSGVRSQFLCQIKLTHFCVNYVKLRMKIFYMKLNSFGKTVQMPHLTESNKIENLMMIEYGDTRTQN